MQPPAHLRHIRAIIYAGCGVVLLATPIACAFDTTNLPEILIGSRQLFGLWALALLLVAMVIGPLTAVFPRLPGKAHLILGRRAVGVSAFILGVAHALCYSLPTASRGLAELFAPGWVWTLGLSFGAFGLVCLALLTWTSTDRQLVRLGPRWKQWHAAVYWVLPLIFIHAKLLGTDFGAGLAPDVKAAPDYGAFLGLSAFAAAWLTLFILRKRGWRKA
jgi:DMSO/TMAO reductase YedYZ heme-binding membrane subunit